MEHEFFLYDNILNIYNISINDNDTLRVYYITDEGYHQLIPANIKTNHMGFSDIGAYKNFLIDLISK